MTGPDRHEPVRLLSLAYYEAEFGPIDSQEHTSAIGPTVERTPAFLVWPQLLDDEPPPIKLRPVDPPPEAA